jgi:rhamnosyltransferase subunit B
VLRILLAAWGSAGDVAPFIGVGRELRRRGHDVTLIALPVFESAAVRAGLSFQAVGTASIFDRLASAELWSHDRPLGPETRSFLVDELPPVRVDQYYDAIAERQHDGATVIVAHPRAIGAELAHLQLGVPLAVLELAPSGVSGISHPAWPLPTWVRGLGTIGRRAGWGYMRARQTVARRLRGADFALAAADTAGRERVRKWRATRPPGIPKERLKRRTLGAWPSWFAPAQVPAEVDLVGFVFQNEGDPARDARPADEAPSVARPIVFTTGSVAGSQREFFAAAVAAARMLDHPAVLVTRYADQLPRQLPSGVTHLEYAPFDELFRNAGAGVHHGGLGTVAPQLAKPMARDQFDNSDRMEQLGVGRMIDDRGLRPSRLARALGELLSSPAVAERCAHWRAQVDPAAGATNAADRVESLARDA